MDSSSFDRLAVMAGPFDTEGILGASLWSDLYEYADGDVPEPDHIVEITDLWAASPEGWASTDIALLARLVDGRWATCVAWSDTTGFGCQHQVDWRINPSREQAIRQGLDKAARVHLGLPLPEDGIQ